MRSVMLKKIVVVFSGLDLSISVITSRIQTMSCSNWVFLRLQAAHSLQSVIDDLHSELFNGKQQKQYNNNFNTHLGIRYPYRMCRCLKCAYQISSPCLLLLLLLHTVIASNTEPNAITLNVYEHAHGHTCIAPSRNENEHWTQHSAIRIRNNKIY